MQNSTPTHSISLIGQADSLVTSSRRSYDNALISARLEYTFSRWNKDNNGPNMGVRKTRRSHTTICTVLTTSFSFSVVSLHSGLYRYFGFAVFWSIFEAARESQIARLLFGMIFYGIILAIGSLSFVHGFRGVYDWFTIISAIQSWPKDSDNRPYMRHHTSYMSFNVEHPTYQLLYCNYPFWNRHSLKVVPA